MTRPDLDALAALLDKATPRPWSYTRRDDHDAPASIAADSGQSTVAMCPRYGLPMFARDAALIVAAVNALPALLAYVRELERERVHAIASARRDAEIDAALAMRERCAQACERRQTGGVGDYAVLDAERQSCAAAIRALKP